VHADTPIKSLAELVAYAKAHPGEVTYGTTGIGSDDHLAAMMFEKAAGVKRTNVRRQSPRGLWRRYPGVVSKSGSWRSSESAVLCGLPLPHKMGWRELIVGGLIASMGFSIGLFFGGTLFPLGQLRSEISMGVLMSLVAGPLALAAAWLLRVGRFDKERATASTPT